MKLLIICVFLALVFASSYAKNESDEDSSEEFKLTGFLDRQLKKLNSCHETCGIHLFDWFNTENSKGHTKVFSSCCSMRKHNCETNNDFVPKSKSKRAKCEKKSKSS